MTVALHPQCKAFLDQLAAMGGRPMHEMTPAEARGLALPPELAGPERPMHSVVNRTVPGPAGQIPVRVYTPTAAARLPGLIYFRGGGFVLGTLDSCDRVCRDLADLAGRVVVSVDYRLAPEHPFPAPVDDAYAATTYVREHAGEFGIDEGQIAIGGESAGGNLAAVTALKLRESGASSLAFQLLVYPLVDFNDDSPSMREFADGHFITADLLEYFARHYLGTQDRRQQDASPLHADLRGLPPAFVLTAECDPLRDQGEAYARKLADAGVPVTQTRHDGMIHPFFSLAGLIDGGRTAIADAAAALRGASAQERV
ncbi:MAG TPA: alpha/beta hydrolase [Vicinamibacterales bacterium]|nr:alpha/beta hydrolase [Vicinamibacterales bacterium]